MADGTRIYEPPPGPDETVVDTHEITVSPGDVRKRQRVSLAGTAADSDVAVLSTTPTGSETGVVARIAGPVKANLSDGSGVAYDASHPLPVSIADLSVQQLTVQFPNSVVSTLNSSTAALGASGQFVGEWEDITKYAAVSCVVLTDAASAVNGAVVDFSDNANTVVRSVAASIPANVGLTFMFGPEARYFRLRYLNGSNAQTYLHAQTILHYQAPTIPQVPLGSTVSDLSLAALTRASVAGRTAAGQWLPVLIDSNGRFVVNINGDAAVVNGSTPLHVTVDSVPEVEIKNDVGNPVPTQVTNFPASQAVTEPHLVNLDIALSALRDALRGSGAKTLTDVVTALAGSLTVTGPLTNTQLRATPVPASDAYTNGQVLADQTPGGSVATFTFSTAQDLIWVKATGGNARVDPFGGTPNATTGIPCDDGIPNPLTIHTSTVQVYAPGGVTVSVWGYRYG